MNLLMFTLEYPPFHGGIANYYGNLVKYWPKADKMFVLNNNDSKLLSQNIPFIRVMILFFILYKEIKLKKIDHVIVGNVLPLGTVAYLISRFLKVSYSVVLHGTDFSFATRQYRKKKITRTILNNAGNIVCANSFTAELVDKFLKRNKKVEIVNPGICAQGGVQISRSQIKKLFSDYNLEGKYILLSVGRLVRRKGFDSVIMAISTILQNAPNLMYVIIGDGPDRDYLLNIIKINSLEEKVLLLDNVDDERKQLWYNMCNCFILVSHEIGGDYEGFGIVYLEANLAEKPVIAGDSGGVKDVVREGVNGILVDPYNVDMISDAIIDLYRNKNLRDRLGGAGKKMVLRYFDWKDQVEKFYSIVHSK
ncbi:glycosyltransferase family 4 protein [Patescibacteria group bacterium]|nr:glycosyltransferase family 4 protein [Patescibacteria group bacterium]